MFPYSKSPESLFLPPARILEDNSDAGFQMEPFFSVTVSLTLIILTNFQEHTVFSLHLLLYILYFASCSWLALLIL